MKKTTKLMAMMLAVVMLCSVFATTASAAYQREWFSGSCNNNFFTTSTIKNSGYRAWGFEDNYTSRYTSGSSTLSATDHTSRLYLSDKTTKAQSDFMTVSHGQLVSSSIKTDYRGTGYTFCFKVSNSHSGYSLRATGYYGVSTTQSPY